jgi:ribonuclease P protein component
MKRFSRAVFESVYKQGKRVKSNNFSLVYTISSDNNRYFSPVISSKIINKACKRILIKRRLRYIFDDLLKPNIKMIVIIKNNISKINFNNLKQEVKTILKQENILNNEKLI